MTLLEFTLVLSGLLLHGHLLVLSSFDVPPQRLRVLLKDGNVLLQLSRPFLHLTLVLVLSGNELLICLLVHVADEDLLLGVGLDP